MSTASTWTPGVPGWGHRADTVTVGVRPALPTGTYLVSWRVVSDDSHPVSGGFLFGVGTTPDASAAFREIPAAGSGLLGVLAGLARGLGYAGLALVVGATAFLLLVGPSRERRGAAGRLPAAGLVALAAGTVLQFGVQGAQAGGDGVAGLVSPGDLADTAGGPLGSVLVARVLLIVLAAVTLPRLLAGRRDCPAVIDPIVAGLAACLGAGLAVTVALAGHARSGPAVAVVSATMHVVAMSVWLGGLSVLALTTARARRDGEEDSALLVRMPRWSRMAQVSVAVLAITGAYQVWRQTDGLDSVVGSTYGRLLMIKLGLVAAMLACGVAGYGLLRRRYAEAALAAAAWHAPVPASLPMPAPATVAAVGAHGAAGLADGATSHGAEQPALPAPAGKGGRRPAARASPTVTPVGRYGCGNGDQRRPSGRGDGDAGRPPGAGRGDRYVGGCASNWCPECWFLPSPQHSWGRCRRRARRTRLLLPARRRSTTGLRQGRSR